VIDEADLLAPQCTSAEGARLPGTYEDLVRRAGARGLGCKSITQRPGVLHKDILSQSEVLIALRMTGPATSPRSMRGHACTPRMNRLAR